VLDRPTVLIAARGGEKNPWAEPRNTRSLHAAKASRLVRALCDGEPPFGVRQLAGTVGTDPGYVSRLLDLFHREELCERAPRGPVTLVHRARLIRRWALDYRFREAHRFVSFAHAHGVPGALAALRDAGVPYAVAATIGAVPVDAGGNLVLIDAFDPFALEGGFEAGGLRYAARAQIIADLLDSPPPGPAQAASLMSGP